MAPLNTRSAAVVDVILSNHARGYRNAEMISHYLFPRAAVSNRHMRTLKFGKESFRMVNTRRAPGADRKRVQYGFASDPLALTQDSLEALVPTEHQEEAKSVPGIDLAAGAINMVLDVVDLGLEYSAAQIALDAGNYGANNKLALTGADKWSDPASDPAKDVKAGKEAVRRQIGRYPNMLEIGANVFNALSEHPKIKEQFKYTSSDSVTVEMLAKYFDLEKVVVGKAVYLPENSTDDDQAIDVWGDDALLAFVPQANQGNFMVPSFGYTYELNGYPQVMQPYYENRNSSWVYPTTTERQVILAGNDAGFLIKGAV